MDTKNQGSRPYCKKENKNSNSRVYQTSYAVLSRKPSKAPKHSGRLSIAETFALLTLSPENFSALRTLAKNFMLDPRHSQRQKCVQGHNQKGFEKSKNILHKYVREFLDQKGWGEEYFGEKSILARNAMLDNSHFLWPQDKDKIIQLCEPLLRRIVINERQRLYNITAREKSR